MWRPAARRAGPSWRRTWPRHGPQETGPRRRDRIGEDCRLRRYPGDVVAGHQVGQAARGQPVAAQVVQPDRHARLSQRRQWVGHAGLPSRLERQPRAPARHHRWLARGPLRCRRQNSIRSETAPAGLCPAQPDRRLPPGRRRSCRQRLANTLPRAEEGTPCSRVMRETPGARKSYFSSRGHPQHPPESPPVMPAQLVSTQVIGK